MYLLLATRFFAIIELRLEFVQVFTGSQVVRAAAENLI